MDAEFDGLCTMASISGTYETLDGAGPILPQCVDADGFVNAMCNSDIGSAWLTFGNVISMLQEEFPWTRDAAAVGILLLAGADALSNARFTASPGAPAKSVWNTVQATQEVYQGTIIPRSFNLTTSSGQVWVHGNGTKHLAEYVAGAVQRGGNATSAATKIMTSFHAAVEEATQSGIVYNQLVRAGRWELIFAPPRQAGYFPVIKHALYVGN